MSNWGLSKYIKTKMQATCFHPMLSSKKKNKKRSGTSLLASFCAYYSKKSISFVIFYWLTKFHCLATLLCEILDNMWIAFACKPGRDVMNFEVNLICLIKPFFLHEQKSWQKFRYLENKKNLIKQKPFFMIFKEFSLKQITQFFL